MYLGSDRKGETPSLANTTQRHSTPSRLVSRVYPRDTGGLALASRYVTNDLHMQEEWLLTTKEGV